MGLLRAAMIGHVAGSSARRQMEDMQKQAQASAKTDPMQEIAKLGELKAF
jgi:hypothetical protein